LLGTKELAPAFNLVGLSVVAGEARLGMSSFCFSSGCYIRDINSLKSELDVRAGGIEENVN
jgi:hypothetical protein